MKRLGGRASIAVAIVVGGLFAACAAPNDTNEQVQGAANAEARSGGAAFYHSDSCESGDLIATVGPTTDCHALATHTSSSVWGVRLAGTCYDVSDADVATACKRFRGAGTTLFHSDSCEAGDLLASVGAGADCDALASVVSSSVWGVKIDGKCADVSDTDVVTACVRYGGGTSSTGTGTGTGGTGTAGGTTSLYHSDSCDSGSLLATMGPTSNCDVLGAHVSSGVWALKIDGVCYDISDTDARSACLRFKGGGATIFHSDSCEGGDMIASVGPGTDCGALSGLSSSSAWGIAIDGHCYDISDVDLRAACERYKGGGAAFFHSDSCAAGDLIAVVGGGTNCQALGSQVSSSVWGIMIDGKCTDISDTDVVTACTRYGGGG